MSDSRTPLERLDSLLAGLEDGVLRATGVGGGSRDSDASLERLATMRSDIEEIVRAKVDRAE